MQHPFEPWRARRRLTATAALALGAACLASVPPAAASSHTSLSDAQARAQAQAQTRAREQVRLRANEEARRQRDQLAREAREAREQAQREAAARAQRERNGARSTLDRQWDDARDRAGGLHTGDLVSRRALALVIGLLWLWLIFRGRFRRRTARI